MTEKQFYITTPIYYVNDVPHIGHAYTTIAADALARYKRLTGWEVHFLTGTDEHGQKVQRAAGKRGETPQQLADQVVERFRHLWQRLAVSNDDFIRTTEERHKRVVQQLFQRVYEVGDIYLGEYEGLYDTTTETYYTELQAPDGLSPDTGLPLDRVREKSYFFRMSRYEKPLLEHFERHPEFVQPESRRNEVLQFVRSGLRDLSVSRTSFDWGIPVTFDPGHVIYVWFDALVNYFSAVGGFEATHPLNRFWPASIHLVGKDILRFHSVYWPTFLMSAGLPVPQRVFAHGWWTVEGRKMSKSLANVVEPNRLIDEYGADPLRYFLLREVSFGLDGDFSHKALIQRINSDLANDLGNLVQRCITMVGRYCDGVVPSPSAPEAAENHLVARAEESVRRFDALMDQLGFDRALKELWEFIGEVNRYVVGVEPWRLAKSDAQKTRLGTTLYFSLEAVRLIALLISPFMPGAAATIWGRLGLEGDPARHRLPLTHFWGGLPAGTRTRPGEVLFPRVDEGKLASVQTPVESEVGIESAPPASTPLTLAEFQKLELRVAEVVAAELVPKSKRLVKITVNLGDEERTLVAGIGEQYDAGSLVGKQIVVVTNLQPATLMGVVSRGMLLAAEDAQGRPILLTVDRAVSPGSKVH